MSLQALITVVCPDCGTKFTNCRSSAEKEYVKPVFHFDIDRQERPKSHVLTVLTENKVYVDIFLRCSACNEKIPLDYSSIGFRNSGYQVVAGK